MSLNSSLFGPAAQAFNITPSDSDDLQSVCRGIYVGGNGNLRLELVDNNIGDYINFIGIIAGTFYALQIRKVYSTGTTATNLIGLI